jgi:acetoin utilization deacetylase AcuC-like enzyme
MATIRLKIGYNISNLHHGPNDHYECPDRINHTIELLKHDVKLNCLLFSDLDCSYIQSKLLNDLIVRVHGEQYLNIMNYWKSLNESMIVGCDTFITPYSYDTIMNALKVLISTLEMINREGVKYGYCLIRPPGHHCSGSAEGFCLVNNVMIASQHAQSLGYKKVFIIDWDVHHGNGTQQLVNSFDNIYFVSIHQFGSNFYPQTGSTNENTDRIKNIPMKRNSTGKHYMNALNLIAFPFLEEVRPDIIIISNGLDAHIHDPVGGMHVTDHFYVNMTKKLKTYDIPLLYVLEGGYNVNVISRVSGKILHELSR